MALVRRIMAQRAVARFRPEETSPSPETADRDALHDYARRVVSTVFHPVGACRMGRGRALWWVLTCGWSVWRACAC
jgi:choline dehydrogenase